MTFTSTNPATARVLKTFASHTKEEAMGAVARADGAFREWRTSSFSDRRRVLLDFAGRLRERQDDLAELITKEMGKRLAEARGEIEYCAKIMEFYGERGESFLADQSVELAGVNAYIQHAPIGVLLGVMPWNFPFYQVIRFAAPNIMAGNTVLLKHAPTVPQCASAISELFDECGLPRGVYTNLFAPTELVGAIIEDERVRGVSLTGSEAAGAAVAAVAGRNLKRSVLELGGNDPFIVLGDVDLDHVLQMAVRGRLVNTGQSCVAAKRFIVVDSLVGPFTQGLKERFAALKVGDPMHDDTDVGPLSSEAAAKDLAAKVQRTVDAGATVVLGGDRPDRVGAYYNPTILTGVTRAMPSFDQELFGPVATIYGVQDEEEAIELANDSSFGLGGSVYTNDLERGRRVAERIESGMVFLNQPTRSQVELPFGGTKNSGYGRELSELGILEFINKKLIHLGHA